MRLIATCSFGLESLVKKELKDLGFSVVAVDDGRIEFETDFVGVAKANLWLRCADRVQVIIGEFEAATFDELFDAVCNLEWEKFIGIDDEFPVDAISVQSALHSEPAIQSIVKKAIVKRLSGVYKIDRFSESSEVVYKVFARVKKNKFTLTIDTSGDSLHKRGYREKSNLSPIKETLASAILKLSDFEKRGTLVDLFCGSGTFLIEAFLMSEGIAPGFKRNFAFEKWRGEQSTATAGESRDCERDLSEMCPHPFPLKSYGFDIDPAALKIAKQNAKNAGFENINLKRSDFRDLDFSKFENCTFVCNPPYGERMQDEDEVREMYRELGKKFEQAKNCSLYIITSHQDFPQLFGKKETRNRKLFNGNIKCYLFSYES